MMRIIRLTAIIIGHIPLKSVWQSVAIGVGAPAPFRVEITALFGYVLAICSTLRPVAVNDVTVLKRSRCTLHPNISQVTLQ